MDVGAMRRVWPVILAILLVTGAGASQDERWGFEAQHVDDEIQERVESALRSKYSGWSLTRERPWSSSNVRLLGSWKRERLEVRTQYMVTAEDAKRRLKFHDYSSSIGIGNTIRGIGDEAFLMIYGSQVILRFRQHEVVVEIRESPERREGPWDDGLAPQRRKIVLGAGKLVAEQIRGF
jgi:hypothetical protein